MRWILSLLPFCLISSSFGLTVDAVRPRELSPAGGEVVTVLGKGLTQETVITFGEQKAEVVEVTAKGLRVRTPVGKPGGPLKVTAALDGQTVTSASTVAYPPHPYMAFKGEDGRKALVKKFADPRFADYRAALLKQAKAAVDRGPIDKDFKNAGAGSINVLTWAYVLSGEKPYREKLMSLITQACKERYVGDFQQMTFTAVALAYDATFLDLSADEKGMIIEYLDIMHRYYQQSRKAWFYNNPSNTVAVAHCGGGLVSMALMHSTEAAKADVAEATKGMTRYLKSTVQSDGSYIEGTLYWDYGLTHALIYAHCLRNATGEDGGLLAHKGLSDNDKFVDVVLGGDGLMSSFNDTQPWLTGTANCAFLDAEFDKPRLRWLADHMAKEMARDDGANVSQRPHFFPWAFVWRSDKPAPKTLDLPTVAVTPKQMWATLRSDPAFIPSALVSIKGQAGNLSHHKQADLGGFVYYAGGESFVIDPGYYQAEADDHSLPLIDGAGPGKGTGANITTTGETGTQRWAVIDATAGYKGKTGANPASRVRRLFVLNNQTLVILDDLVAAGAGKITAQLQLAGEPKIDAKTGQIELTRGKTTIAVRFFGPSMSDVQAKAQDFEKSWIFKKLEEAGKMKWHRVTASYTADEAKPLVTILQPTKSRVPVVNYAADVITVTIDGATLKFTKGDKGWQRAETN